jgi:hypothetical protein
MATAASVCLTFMESLSNQGRAARGSAGPDVDVIGVQKPGRREPGPRRFRAIPPD